MTPTPEQLPELRRKERLKGLSDIEVVQLWYKAPDADDWTLTPRQDAIRRRIDFAKAQFLARRTYMEIAHDIEEEFSVSIATARNDIRAAMQVFGELDRVPKEAHRARAVEMSLAAFRLAEDQKDPDGMAKATKNYILATGVDKDDPDLPDLEKIMRERIYVEVLDARWGDLLRQFIDRSGGSVDMSRLFEAIYGAAQDVEHEDVPESAAP